MIQHVCKAMATLSGFCLFLSTLAIPFQAVAEERDEAGVDPPALVEVAVVVRDEVSSASQFVATVVPTRRSIVGTAVDGRVESFLYDKQQPDRKLTRVSTGDVLAQLKTDTIERELGTAAAELKLREQELIELRNGSRREELQITQAQLRRWQASLEYETARYGRLRKLFDANNSISLDQLEEAQSAVTQAEQSCAEAQAKYELAVAGPRAEQIAQAEARVEAQQQTVHMLEEMLRKYTVRAPFDGYVVNEFTEVGAWVSQGDPVAEVIQLVPLEVEASLPEKHLSELQIGAAAEIRLTAMPERSLPGRVERIIPQADIRSRTFPIRIRLDESINPENDRIMAGMLGHVVLTVQGAQVVKLVPKDALVLNATRHTVVVVDQEPLSADSDFMGVARVVPVQLGITRGSLIQIRGDIEVGDLIVTRGNERLRQGQSLVWKNSPDASQLGASSGPIDAARSLSSR